MLEIELTQERNPANPICEVAEVTLHLKGIDAAREGGQRATCRTRSTWWPTTSRGRSSATATSAADRGRRGLPGPRRSRRSSPVCRPAVTGVRACSPAAAGQLVWGAMPKILDQALRLGEATPVQAVREARRSDQPLRARARAARGRRAHASSSPSCASARAERRVARRRAAGVLRDHPRGRAAARWACATSTCS